MERQRAIALLEALNDTEKQSSILIHPHGMLRARWDLLVSFVVIEASVFMPLQLAFGMSTGHWPLVTSALLCVDIVLNLFTGYESGGVVVMRHGRILRNYLTGMAWVDVASTVPWQLLAVPWQVQMLGLLKVARLPRMFQRLELVFRVRSGPSKLLRFAVLVLLTSHLLCCGFFALGNRDNGWAVETGVGHGAEAYIVGLYWAVMTLTTIGYGDVSPVNSEERLFVIVAMVIGAGIFAYSVSDIVDLALQMGQKHAALRSQLEQVEDYAAFYQLPASLRAEIRSFYSARHSWELFEPPHEERILEDVPAGTKAKIAEAINPRLIERLPFLRNAHPLVTLSLSRRITEVYCAPGEVVFEQGSRCEAMFFISAGSVDVIKDGIKITTLGENQYFGEAAITQKAATIHSRRSYLQPNNSQGHAATAMAATFAKLLRLTQRQVFQALAEHPGAMAPEAVKEDDDGEEEAAEEAADAEEEVEVRPSRRVRLSKKVVRLYRASRLATDRARRALASVAPSSGTFGGRGMDGISPMLSQHGYSSESSSRSCRGPSTMRISDGRTTIDFATSSRTSPQNLSPTATPTAGAPRSAWPRRPSRSIDVATSSRASPKNMSPTATPAAGTPRSARSRRSSRSTVSRAASTDDDEYNTPGVESDEDARRRLARQRWHRAVSQVQDDLRRRSSMSVTELAADAAAVLTLNMHSGDRSMPMLSPASQNRTTFGTGVLNQGSVERMMRAARTASATATATATTTASSDADRASTVPSPRVSMILPSLPQSPRSACLRQLLAESSS